MGKARRIIRKTRPARFSRMDDQAWPLIIAFCLLGGFMTGMVLAYLRLDDARWYANAWTYLIAIPLVISTSLVALALTGNRLLRRTMQLALILCILVHLVLFIVAIETDVFHRVWTEVLASTERLPKKKVTKVPQYNSWQHDQRRQAEREFDQPVKTEVPDPVIEPTPRETLQEEPADVPFEPQATPQSQPVPRPNVVRREQINQSVPRQREQSSQLSRREAELPAQPTQAVPVPDQVRRPQRQPDVLQPGESGTPKVKQPLASERSPRATPPAMSEQSNAAQLTRNTRQSVAPQQPTAAAPLPRREREEGITPRSDVAVADKPAVAQENQPAAVQPNNTTARKQQSRSIERREPVTLPIQTMANESTLRRRSLQQPTPPQRALAQTPRATESQRPRLTTRPDLTSPAAAAVNNRSGEPTPAASEAVAQPLASERTATPAAVARTAARADAQSESVAQRVMPANSQRAVAESSRPETAAVSATLPGRRPARATAVGSLPQRVSPLATEATAQTPTDPAPSGAAASRASIVKASAGNTASQPRFPSVETLGAAPERQRAERQLTRRTAEARPSLNAQAAADQPARRATRVAASPSSPTSAENPVRRSSAASAPSSSATPSSLAVNKAQAGTAGRGASANLGLSAPAADSPANVASGSAQRAAATQSLPPGPVLSPQAPAMVRNSRAGQLQPSAVLKATPLAPAARAGSRNPAEVTASASAALTQAAADAARGPITASKGALEVDLGPTTRLTQAGVGRASGGGQPLLSPGVESRSMPRAAQGQAPAASLLADMVSPTAAAPATDGGGRPQMADLDSNPNAMVNAREAPSSPALGGPQAAEGGAIAAPTHSLAASSRRAANASDGPQLAEPSNQLPLAGRKANRDRQLEGDTSVADLSAGNAATRDDRQTPATMLAANAAAASVGKQVLGGKGAISADMTAAAPSASDATSPSEGALAARAEAVAAPAGPPVPGGGTKQPARAAQGPQLATDTQAETLELAGAATSSGREEADPQSTQGPLITRLAGGVDAPRGSAPVGGRSAELAVDAAQGNLAGVGPARRAASNSAVDGPAVQSDVPANPLAKRTPTGLSASPVAAVVLDGLPAGNPLQDDAESEPGPIADSPSVGAISRLAGAAMPVTIDARVGPGGLDRQVTVEVGVRQRQASEISDQVQLKAARFARQQVGGMPDLNTTASVAAEPFRRRARRGQGVGAPASGAGPETEEAIELGLVYLSRMQTSDGRWTLDGSAQQDGLPQLASDTAATGLALLAFQGAGYNHREYRYASVVRGGVEFLVQSQKPNGDLFVTMDQESNRVVALYSHSIAALALSEAYGMTQDPALREPAQKALDFIVQTQHPSRGGWRYAPGVGSDTSVTGWMMMALKSGELANLKVPDDTYARIRQWLDQAQLSSDQPHLYCYNPYAPDTAEQRGGRRPTRTMTSVGLLMRLYSGWRRDNPNMARGADYLLEAPPATGTTANPLRDTYYWYYATQVMFHMGGQYWNAWNQRLHPLLVGSQIRDGELAGSWDPQRPVPDEWAAFAGRLYVTTLNLLSLEVTYRHLPLYEDTAR